MSRRRTSKISTKNRQLPVQTPIEKLEQRQLLTTVITDTNPLTATPATETFEYKDAEGNTVRVVVHGDVSAEFVFARVTKGDKETGAGGNDVILGDHVGPTTRDEKGKLIATPEDGRDLFHVFIAQASIDSFISVAEVPVFSAQSRPMTPFSGSVDLTVTPNRGNTVGRSTDGGTGAIYLGAKSRDTAAEIDDEENRPFRKVVFNGLGLLPVTPNNRLVAGITTASGVSIGKFLFGGAVSGNVRFLGSVDTFYCGALLTGVTEGQSEGTPLDPGNFFVQGDIRNILVKGAIGSDGVASTGPERAEPEYWTGVDFEIHGRAGQIRTGDDYLATGTVYNDNAGLGLRTRQQEIEVRVPDNVNRGSFTEFEIGQLGDRESFFNNDSFETAQFLGSINSKQLGANSVQLNGLFQWVPRVQDTGDFYAVALMAGQTVGVRLLAPIVGSTIIVNGQPVTTEELKSVLHVGVFDPDNRLIASDWSNVSDTTSQSQDTDPAQQEYFSFTADKPGIYRFAVGKDATFNTPGTRLGLEQPYQLQLTGIGNISMGGLVAENTIYAASALTSSGNGQFNFDDSLASIKVLYGDLGAIYTISDFMVSAGGFVGIAVGGDFRAIDTISMGQQVNGAFGDGIGIEAITGSIGMIRTRGTDSSTHTTLFNDSGRGSLFVQPIGGDVQYIVAPNIMGTDLAVNGSVGVLQAAQWGFGNYAGSLSVNADGKGKPGIIDLIDITANIGSLSAGGPIISTNRGGNVRYIHISPTSTAYRPFLFGSSQPEETTYVQGQEANITDDSGAQVRIIPTQEEAFNATTGLVVSNSGTLTVLTYPIAPDVTTAGGGGVVIIRATSTRGLQVRASGGSAEIGEILSTGSGPGLVQGIGPDGIANSGDEDPGADGIVGTTDDPFEINPALDSFGYFPDNSVDLVSNSSKNPIDVYMVRGNNFPQIRNRTTGEIVNTSVSEVGLIEANNLGWARPSLVSGMAIERQDVVDLPGTSEVEGDTFPFNGTKNGIVINGASSQTSPAVATVRTRQALGNLLILGRVERITANADGAGVKGVHEGIIGNVFAKGELRRVEIGEGLLPSGTGNMSRAGIYCVCDPGLRGITGMGRVQRVLNQGDGSDIRGDIISNTGIGSIELNSGSIINADVRVTQVDAGSGTGADLSSGLEFGGAANVIVQGVAGGAPFGNIDSISVNGYGGIIGLTTVSASIGPINSTGGFGIINSNFQVLGNGRFGTVFADGYGVRGGTWEGGQSLDGITAKGDGRRLTTTSFEPSLRLSETLAVDPFFGTKPNPLTDLHVLIGTTKDAPQRKGTSASGSFDISSIHVSRDVGFIRANTIRACEFNIANNVSSITTNDYVDSVALTCGRIDTLAIGKDSLRSSFEIAGPVGNVYVGGSFRGSSHLSASGQNGKITTFTTGKSLYGDVYAQQSIGTIRVGTVYGSQGTRTAGGMQAFITNGDVLASSVLTVEKNLAKLVIGEDLEDSGLVRVGTLGTKTIIGDEIGVVDIKPWGV